MSDTATAVNNVVLAKLSVQSPQGPMCVRELSEGDNLTVGTASDCEIQVEGEGIATMHCMVGITGGKIWVRDCYSKSGTLVNGSKVTEAKVTPDDDIQIGSLRLSIAESDPSHGSPVFSRTTPSEPSPLDDRETKQGELAGDSAAQEPEQEPRTEPNPATTFPAPTFSESPTDPVEQGTDLDDSEAVRLRAELDRALREIVELRSQLQKQKAQPSPRREATTGDPFQEEMIELLRDEVSQLQAELAQRDSQLADASWPSPGTTEEPHPIPEAPAFEKGLERLDQLIEELDRKDAHIRSLEGLLATAEEATTAEQEERNQLESWVTDIEERMGARESEWEANLESLRDELEERTRERDRARGALENAAAEGEDDAAGLHERLTENLREQVASLEKRLAEAQRRRGEIERHSAEAPEGGSSAYIEAKVEEQLRAERVELARERAALARAQAEFEKSRRRAVGGGDPQDDVSPEDWSAGLDSSQRIRALRDHLKEVHDEEQKTRHNRGVSGRIASLWKRLENRDD